MTELDHEHIFPAHVSSLIENVQDVLLLMDLHVHLIGGKVGRPADWEVLHKSGVVLLVACWEAYVEDLAKNAFDEMLAHGEDPSAFPNKVLALACKPLKEDHNHLEPWKLAGDGWRSVLGDYRDALLDRFIGGLTRQDRNKLIRFSRSF